MIDISKRIKKTVSLLFTTVILGLFFNISFCHTVSKDASIAGKNIDIIDILLEKDYLELKSGNLDRIKKMIGKWKVAEYVLSPRDPVIMDIPVNEVVGNELIVKNDLSVIFKGTEYEINEAKNLTSVRLASIHGTIFGETAKYSKDYLSIGLIRKSDHKTADFGLYLNRVIPGLIDEEVNYIWAGEGYRKNGMYKLIKLDSSSSDIGTKEISPNLAIINNDLNEEIQENKKSDIDRIKKLAGTWRINDNKHVAEIVKPSAQKLIVDEELNFFLDNKRLEIKQIKNLNHLEIDLFDKTKTSMGLLGNRFLKISFASSNGSETGFCLYLEKDLPELHNREIRTYIGFKDDYFQSVVYELLKIR